MPVIDHLMLPEVKAKDVATFFANRGESDYMREFFAQFGGWQYVEGECPNDGDTILTEDTNVCLICGQVVTKKYEATFTFTLTGIEAANDDDAEERAIDEAKGIMGASVYYEIGAELDRVTEEL